MHDPEERIRVLKTRCVHGLTLRQLQILGCCALGYSTDEIAEALCLSKPTVFRHVEILEVRIFESTDIIPSRHLLAAWTHVQRDCCAHPVWQMIEKHQLFGTGHQPGRRQAPR